MTRLLVLLASMTLIVLLAPGHHRIDLFVVRWGLSGLNAILAHSLYVDVRRCYLGRLNRHQRDI